MLPHPPQMNVAVRAWLPPFPPKIPLALTPWIGHWLGSLRISAPPHHRLRQSGWSGSVAGQSSTEGTGNRLVSMCVPSVPHPPEECHPETLEELKIIWNKP